MITGLETNPGSELDVSAWKPTGPANLISGTHSPNPADSSPDRVSEAMDRLFADLPEKPRERMMSDNAIQPEGGFTACERPRLLSSLGEEVSIR